jgi:hypothetical protein
LTLPRLLAATNGEIVFYTETGVRKSFAIKARGVVRSSPRTIRQFFKSRTPPKHLVQIRHSAVPELEAVTLSTTFPGCLNVSASIVTLNFLPAGLVVEIGAYRGKYLSILRSAVGETCRIVGYDIFDEAQAPLVEREFEKAFGTLGDLILIQVDSTRLTTACVREDVTTQTDHSQLCQYGADGSETDFS